MSEQKKLLDLAEIAFRAIEQNTGERHWTREDGLEKAVEAFSGIIEQSGISGLIDAARGTGLSRLTFAWWWSEAQKDCTMCRHATGAKENN